MRYTKNVEIFKGRLFTFGKGELGEGSSGSSCRFILAITYKKRILKVSDVPEGNTKQ